jgi:uridine phosphorylase
VINDASNVPLLEFDPERAALLEPSSTQPAVDAPTAAVACFFPEVIEEFARHGRAILDLPSREPLWDIEYAGQRLGLFYPGLGAPLASNSLERVIAAASCAWLHPSSTDWLTTD